MHPGSGIAPFFPIPPPASNPLLWPWHAFLFCVRVPLVTFAWVVWLAIIQWTPAGGLLRKANLWCVLGIPGVWWIDIQVDGVRRGSLSQTPRGRLPDPGQIIAASYTSPLDILYLAAIWDPVFTQSQSGSRLVRPVTIEGALAACFDIRPPPPFNHDERAIEIGQLVKRYPNRVIVVFPEATTSNGRGILSLSPSPLSAPKNSKIYPVSLRYTPAEIVTPLPGWLEAARFVWRLNSRPTHCIRARIGAPLTIASTASSVADTKTNSAAARRDSIDSNFFDTLGPLPVQSDGSSETEQKRDDGVTEQERKVLDAIADTLARLGRVKRVGLGVEEKKRFVDAWWKGRKAR